MKACKDCRFHVKHDETIGFCWRYPPQMAEPEKSVMPPVTSDKTWCGEFRSVPNIWTTLFGRDK